MSGNDSGPLYLGFDLSTQQIKAIVIRSDLSVVAEAKVDFDADFGARYGVRKGVLRNEAEGEVFAPVAMWVEAVDLVLARLRDHGDGDGNGGNGTGKGMMGRIRGISGSGQQHSSVFWSASAERALGALDPDPARGPMVEQLRLLGRGRGGRDDDDALAYPFAPSWQDHSTQRECDDFNAHLGGAEELARVTGSAAHHRFTGTQILRMRRRRPEVYAATARISLASSFLASLLLGTIAPIDISDVTGMNLWDVAAEAWSPELLELTAGGTGTGTGSGSTAAGGDAVAELRRKLGDVPVEGGGSLGPVSAYLVGRYGFDPACRVTPLTGDNPATILSLPLRPHDAVVSLGTSSTFLMSTPTYRPDPSYHFMNHPTTKGHFMFMLCYKNGGLAREKVRDRLPVPPPPPPRKGQGQGQGADEQTKTEKTDPWENFNRAVLETPPLDVPTDGEHGDGGRAKLGLYFPLPEIVPNVRAGTWRYTCRASDGGDLLAAATETDGSSAQQQHELPPPQTTTRGQDGHGQLQLRRPWTAEADARAIVESQALSMRLRSRGLVRASGTRPGLPAQPRRIYLVGGGSLNPAIARVFGDVLGGADGVYRLDRGGNACALGGAYKALWAAERDVARDETFDELIGRRWREGEAVQKVDEGYRPATWARYGAVLGAFEDMERRVLDVAHN
ncbi:actin-like ATPase domain-containing protein [Xylariaceae sp. FL0804]|nr:actin-like ATPase domain-containing protein [Xylariaceae sp. FL0804]